MMYLVRSQVTTVRQLLIVGGTICQAVVTKHERSAPQCIQRTSYPSPHSSSSSSCDLGAGVVDAVRGKFNYSGNKSWLQEANRRNIRRACPKDEIPTNFLLAPYLAHCVLPRTQHTLRILTKYHLADFECHETVTNASCNVGGSST
jgi:hypothetical protein